MKKLNLKALELGVAEILTREQLKKMVGGTGGTCGARIPISAHIQCNVPNGTRICGDPEYLTFTDISMANALCLTQGVPGANWCCDHCTMTAWYVTCSTV